MTISIAFFTLLLSTAYATVDVKQVQHVISKAQDNSWSELKDNNWNFPTYLGTWFLSEYYFELQALGLTKHSKFNETFFTQLLLDTQLEDGSWEQVHEHNLKTGLLDATVFNYWYLKTVGVDHEDAQMVKARAWILQNGGIEGC